MLLLGFQNITCRQIQKYNLCMQYSSLLSMVPNGHVRTNQPWWGVTCVDDSDVCILLVQTGVCAIMYAQPNHLEPGNRLVVAATGQYSDKATEPAAHHGVGIRCQRVALSFVLRPILSLDQCKFFEQAL